MKVFISQPMNGKTDEEIRTEREVAIAKVKSAQPDSPVEILDTFFTDYNGNAVQFLGKSIMKLGEADVAVFAPGWEDARGCRNEQRIAVDYGITCLYL